MQKITPFLWFNGNAEEATKFYVSIFKKSKVVKIVRHGASGPGPKGSVMCTIFQLEGQQYYALNGGPDFKFTPAISFFVDCQTQKEIDYFWKKLSQGGKTSQCGWLTDKFGLSWQIVPRILSELLHEENSERSDRVMKAMFKMTKLNVAVLKKAYGKK